MADKLDIIEDHYSYRIAWILDDGDDQGATLGEEVFTEEDLASGKYPDDWEHVMACLTAEKTPNVSRDNNGFHWESKTDATKALRMIRAQLKDKSKKPWPDWALQAKAAGWTPPKGWTP